MGWTKIILIFQAIVTLIIGIAFFSQLLVIDKAEINQIKLEIREGSFDSEDNLPPALKDIKKRYTIAAYTLFIISIFELLIISRLVR
tara:strand:- start:251 stop:511 length:261 start_codon:yes stop_codon:yes gene_type:complete